MAGDRLPWPLQGAGWDARCEPLAVVTRGEAVESVHRGALAVGDESGRLLGAVGDTELPVQLRSAAKPFQALAVVDSGAAAALEITEEELAVMCGSHAGERRQVELVASLLARVGAGPEDLVCGPQPPAGRAARAELEEAGEAPSTLHHMCSGKHAGMLALAHHLGVPLSGYHLADHPVQQAVARVVAELTGLHPAELLGGMDGCGVPVVQVPLLQGARLFACLASGATPGLVRVRDAMLRHPYLIGGPDSFDTRSMLLLPGRLLVKSGAEGVEALALPERGVGAVLKVEDGSHRPVPVLLARLLLAWGLEEGLQVAGPDGDVVRSRVGEPVGRVVTIVEEGRLAPEGVRRFPGEEGPRAPEAGPHTSASRSAGVVLPDLRIVASDGRDREVVRFRREEWPAADEEILGRTYKWNMQRLTLTAREDRAMVGILTAAFVGGVATLEELLVQRGRRGRGIGSALLTAFEREARARRCHKISLRTPLGARAESFYRRHGYRREGVITRHHFLHDYLSLRKDLW